MDRKFRVCLETLKLGLGHRLSSDPARIQEAEKTRDAAHPGSYSATVQTTDAEPRQRRTQRRASEPQLNSLEDVFHPGASEVVGDRVHLVQSGLHGTAAQEVFRVHLVEVEGQLGEPAPLGLTEAREDLRGTNRTWMIQKL